jgi:magnesium-transporting ATPase (P-type)
MAAPHPILQSSRREALVVASLWLVAGVWSVSYCWLNGYGNTPDKVQFTLGFPSWVFWGVVLPWVLCALLSLVIANLIMTDADLGTEPGDEDLFDA